ncbi:DUF4244 domain-containing protein [Streptomyces broussonetiae]|uniref:DUF4244 domain-containing protein n=1 Tax=Streptomyces broussonetiae TaxID=2686304 RepID=A0A6I6N6E7_9ACTN|nr:DUF4244 domain-containing protein [Streptomyces broussonetiae]QHA06011.1 DUF4244 domain-containing protein [Streptomyces broussonetiae]
MNGKIRETAVRLRERCRQDAGMVTSEYAMGIIVILGS